MVKSYWQLLKDIAVFGFGKGILLPLGLITLPVFTRIFVPSDYGVIELTNTIIALLSLFLIMGVDSASTRSYFDSSTQQHRRGVISTGLWFLVAWNLLVVGIVLLSSEWISSLAFKTSQYADLLRIAFIIAPLALLVAYCQNTMRLLFSPWKFTIISLLSGILSVGLSILFVLKFDMELWGYFIGILAGNAIALIPAFYFIKQEIAFTFSLKMIKEMLSYGGPLVPASLAYYVLNLSDRFFLAKFATIADVGLYSVAVKVSSIMLFFYMAFGLAWSPFVFKLYLESEKRMKEVVGRVMKYIVFFFCLIAVFLAIFSHEILSILTTKEYFGAIIAIAPLCLGVVAYATTHITVLGISLLRKTKYIAIVSWVAAIVNLLLNFLLIPTWGILGASVATAISFIVLTFCYYGISQKLYPIYFDKKAVLKICLICVIFIAIGNFIVFDNVVLRIFVKLAFVLLFVAILFLFRVFDSQETAYIRHWFSGFRKVRSASE